MAADQILVSLVLAPAAGVVASRILVDPLPPKAVAFAYTIAAAMFALASTLSLFAFGLPALASLLGQGPARPPGMISWRPGVLSPWLSWLCLLLGVAAVISVLATARRQAASLRAARAEAAALPGTSEIVVVPDSRADAFAVPGMPGRIVVTEGMLTALGAGRHEALFAHERAHLAGRHHLFAFAARLAVAALPLLLPMIAVIDYAIERWADEQAAHEVGDRRSVAHVVGTAALAATERTASAATSEQSALGGGDPGGTLIGIASSSPVLGMRSVLGVRPVSGRCSAAGRRLGAGAGSGRSDARPGPVPRRVAALLTAPQGRTRLLLVAVPAALAAASCGVSVEALIDLPTSGYTPVQSRDSR